MNGQPDEPTSGQSPGHEEEQLVAAVRQQMDLEGRLTSGANWFFWIAVLSVINSVLLYTGRGWSFIFGLGITQIVDTIAAESEAVPAVAAVAVNAVIAGVFVLFGVMARKGRTWAFVVGMLIYALDGLLFVLVQDWLSAGFHAFALFCVFKGLQALNELRRQARAVRPVVVDQPGGPPLV
jgi:hypothetical protein